MDLSRHWAATAATSPIASSRCWPCTRPSASAWWPTSRRGDWPRSIGKNVRTTTALGATTAGLRRGTGSMTCAGITSLVIAADRVQPSDARVVWRPHRLLPRPTRRRHRPHRAGHPMAGATLLRHITIRAPAAPGRSTISMVWSVPGGSPRGGSSRCPPGPDSPAGPTGIAKGPTIWSAPRIACRAFGRAWELGENRSPGRHQLRPAVSFQGALAGAVGQAAIWRRRRLEPAPQRRGQSDPLRRNPLATRPDLAGDRPAAGQRRRLDPDAGPLPLRQPEPAARRSGRAQGAGPKTPRLPGPRRVSHGRGRLRRRGLRQGFSRFDARGVPRAGVQAATAGAGAPDLVCRGEDRSAAVAAAVGDRVRLPHQRGLRPAGPARGSASVAVVFMGAVAAGARREVQPRGPGPSRRRHVAGHQRAGLRHQPRAEDQGGLLPPRPRRRGRAIRSSAAGSTWPTSAIPAAATSRPGRW